MSAILIDPVEIYGSATAATSTRVYRLVQSSTVTSTAEFTIASVDSLQIAVPETITGTAEISEITGSKSLASQYGLGIRVEPINASINVNIIRVL